MTAVEAQKGTAREDGKWFTSQELPRSVCADRDTGGGVWFTFASIDSSSRAADMVDNVLKNRQNLVYWTCEHHRLKSEERYGPVILRGSCGNVLAPSTYNDAAKKLWETFSVKPIHGLSCQGRTAGQNAAFLCLSRRVPA